MFWYVVGLLYWALTWGYLGLGVGRPRHRDGQGFLLGFLCGPLGVAWMFSRPLPEPESDLDLPFPGAGVRRPHDLDRAGPFVPKDPGQAVDPARWAEQMKQLADAELRRRRDS